MEEVIWRVAWLWIDRVAESTGKTANPLQPGSVPDCMELYKLVLASWVCNSGLFIKYLFLWGFMKKSTLVVIIIVAVVAIIAVWCVNGYNRLVVAQEAVATEWSNVESQYQRRSDLIPNLVSVVKGYAAHESGTLEAVVAARSRATQVTVDADAIDEEAIAGFQNAQSEVGAAVGRLLVIAENYPELKADRNFLALQEQLEGTENRIQVARSRFNETARVYNTSIRRFPANIIAGMFGFDQTAYFKADEAAAGAPVVQF